MHMWYHSKDDCQNKTLDKDLGVIRVLHVKANNATVIYHELVAVYCKHLVFLQRDAQMINLMYNFCVYQKQKKHSAYWSL